MMRFIPSSIADQLSNALWSLSRPDSIRQAQDTQCLFDWITDTQGNGWLVALDDYEIIVSPEAELGDISSILQPWIDQSVLPADTITVLSAIVADHAASGEPLNVYNAIPEYFRTISKSYDEMVIEGKISTDQQTLGSPPSAPRTRR